MMGKLFAAFDRRSSYAAKKTTFYADVVDQIEGAMLPADLDRVELFLIDHELEYPASWDEVFAELIEKRRDELASEDLGSILREKFDF